ncbi:Mycophenolic acid acyl-glucuronide esterase, mitochondrial [Perkinsus olseni]|uniref:Mycophenolic acid acyl-glucuronide esterase, mitochondrial n=1 Tax=Perkinsus olseni TaxID=32597 RepID=A0A7J6MFZ0_PEROL|nr:Mycophenolic acid acyl-glucuronide esterase, mitochondrial [Perkinsus olseni]
MSCGLYIPGLCSNCAGRKAMMLQDLCKRHGLPCKLYNYPHWDCSAKLDYSSVYNAASDALLDVATAKSPAVVLAASMGCHFGLRLALDFPDLIKAIVSVGGSYNPGACWRGEDSSEWVYVASRYAEDDGAYKVPMAFLRDMQANYISNFEDIRVPVEVVHGTKDESVPVETGEKLAQLLPRGSLHLIEGGDHRLSTEEDLRFTGNLLKKYLVA